MTTSLPTTRLGLTGMHLTRVGFGAWAIGGGGWAFAWGNQDDAASIAAIRHAVESGINWIDTAAVYGLGHSEEVVAAALAGLPEADRPFPDAATERHAVERGDRVRGGGLDPKVAVERPGGERDRRQLVQGDRHRDRLRPEVPLSFQGRRVHAGADRPFPGRDADCGAVDEHLRVRARLVRDPQTSSLRDRLELRVDRQRLPSGEDELPLQGGEPRLEHADDVRTCRHAERSRERSSPAIATVDAATNSYPKIGLREKTGMTSEMIPKAGSAMM